MKLLVIKFRVNDLDSSYGKQIEFNQRISEDFFEFKENAEKIQFIYKGLTENDINNNTIINASLVKSPARGDYKIYTNENGALFLKQFFLERLKLSSNNINDFFTLKDLGNRKYEISYIPENSEIGRFFKTRNLNNQIVNIVKESKNSNDLTRNSLQRIFYGAPGTGKSHSVKEQTKDQSFIRTTFHPDSDYASFVGCYKPTTKQVPVFSTYGEKAVAVKGSDGQPVTEDRIVYEFVEQAFLQAYINAWKLYAKAGKDKQPEEQYLIIE